MNETQSSQPEQAGNTDKRHEATKLAMLTGLLYEIFYEEVNGRNGADWALDELGDYCIAVSRRDPEMGQILIETLESVDPGESPSLRAAVDSQQISDRLREELGMPARLAEPDQPGTGRPTAPTAGL